MINLNKTNCNYEKIILNKGLDIIERISSCSDSTRPLGFTSPSHQTLGLGSHVFTWRNTSNTCPIIYWWESNGWSPLLPVQNRGQNWIIIDFIKNWNLLSHNSIILREFKIPSIIKYENFKDLKVWENVII